MSKDKSRLTRGEAIHAYCVQCSGGSAYEVTRCHLTDCPLWIYRTGREEGKPKRQMSPAQKAALAKLHEKKGTTQ